MVHSVKNHLKNAVHSFKYFAANCAEVAHLGSKMNNILLMTTMVEYVWMIADVIMNTAWMIITWHHRHSLTRDTWTPDLFSSQWDLPVLPGRSGGPPLILRVHPGFFVIFYVKFLILDFEDCQFTFGSTSFWVVLDFWVFSFGFWILRSVSPPLIVHLFWVVVLDYVRWAMKNYQSVFFCHLELFIGAIQKFMTKMENYWINAETSASAQSPVGGWKVADLER